jgi:multimeric flavodoxin WrbA
MFTTWEEIHSEILHLGGFDVRMCKGCCRCFEYGECDIQDDMVLLKERMLKADHLIFISPVYAHNVNNKFSTYQDLYNRYAQQNNEAAVTQANVQEAKSAYENAKLDIESLKNSFVLQIQSTLGTLEEEIKTLENNQKSLEISLRGIENLDEYEKLSEEKTKNDAVITVNSEIDSLNENITSIESQLIEINETIKDSEVKAAFDGTVTLVGELNVGDIIVQAGN